jgi:hypothetical protein
VTQEQLIEFLKENLRLDVETKSVYMGSTARRTWVNRCGITPEISRRRSALIDLLCL